MTLIQYGLVAIALIVLTNLLKQAISSSPTAPFPKGPKPLPYLGNLHQIPLTKAFLAFASWSRSPSTSTSDGIVGLQLGPKARVVILSKWTHVRDLFDSRGKGAIYADRPFFGIADYVIPKPPGTDLHLVFARYGAKWRRARRTVVEFLSEKETDHVLSIQDAESTQMMWEFLGLGDNAEGDGLIAYHRYVLRYFGSVILASVFGLRSKDSDEKSRVGRFFAIQDEWAGILDQGQAPPIDIFPWLNYVPDFLTPWKGWRERANLVKTNQSKLYHELFAEMEARVKAGKTQDCFLGKLLISQDAAVKAGRDKDIFTQLELDYIGGFLMEGGADTTAMAFETFILAMAAYPELQKQAQEEVDQFFGQDKMPHTADGKNLPFLKACFFEALRWRPSFPNGVPHANTADDEYQGFSIPKGTTVIANTWAISHDPDEFDEPDSYMPSRYLANRFGCKTKENDAGTTEASQLLDSASVDAAEISSSGRRQTYSFGAGRRVCAGQRMAENSSMMNMAKLMWSFDVVYGGVGKPDVDVQRAWRDSLLTGPKLFPVKFIPRSESKRNIIRQEWEKADQFLSQFE
ncbi:cytochrome p450 [Diaporthe amygdali]|uniref:cytochrome p450 n=1 Tax=Phomopsis amygdali TaxID=1214568 RepID=UPI0022FEC8BD|nr:cytochrome p450 [Diaporthe amygdali]KAJ0120287.1 cytochrome p450 [Diaporthe amygdali]